MVANPLYTTHIPLNQLQRGAVTVLSGLGALANPARADLVAAFGETTGASAFNAMRDRMLKHPTGQQILNERPRVTNEVALHAKDMPEGSFGHGYISFMEKRGFEADERPPVRFVNDEQLAYIATRYREVHDFWHVLFRCPTTVSGELALKAVEFVQTGLPMTALAVLGAQAKLKADSRDQLWYRYVPWAIRAGSFADDLMCIYYEKHFQEPIQDVRRKWRIIVAPKPPKAK